LTATKSEIHRLDARAQGLTLDSVSPNAIDVATKLQDAGFAGFLVGGCVRDLLLGLTPKDFDVATDATPEQVNALFRRSRLVGRRFRIAHVRYGRELIEVSTFRRAVAEEADERRHSDAGMILRDNVYGTLEEDAFRRDFTINALYYDPLAEELIDYVGGLEDLDNRRIRFIGDTPTRIREDPVRALRAIRFQTKLECETEGAIANCFEEAAELMAAIPAARLFDEIQKLLLSGQAGPGWELFASTPLRTALFPSCDPNDPLIDQAMRNTDARISAGKPVTPAFLLAALLWNDYQARVNDLSDDMQPSEAKLHAASECLATQQQIIAIPRRFSQFIREVWYLQDRLEVRMARSVERLASHTRFRAAYDFLVLRAETEAEHLQEAADWWTLYQEVDADQQSTMIDERRSSQPKKKRRRRRKAKRSPDSDDSDVELELS
jgi:poly(A) polymerase